MRAQLFRGKRRSEMKEGIFEIKEDFYLNGKPFKIISGAIHYFRIVPEYWRDRLEKLKANPSVRIAIF